MSLSPDPERQFRQDFALERLDSLVDSGASDRTIGAMYDIDPYDYDSHCEFSADLVDAIAQSDEADEAWQEAVREQRNIDETERMLWNYGRSID